MFFTGDDDMIELKRRGEIVGLCVYFYTGCDFVVGSPNLELKLPTPSKVFAVNNGR